MLLIIGVVLTAGIALGSVGSDEVGATEILFIIAIGILGVVIGYTLISPNGSLSRFDIAHPLSFYGFFYLLYYLLPGVLVALGHSVPRVDLLPIAGLIILGYVGLWAGIKVSGINTKFVRRCELNVSMSEAWGLLWLCYAGAALLVVFYAWRISIGAFYSHARYYQQETTLFASFMDVFVAEFQLPLILLLGLLSGVPQSQVKRQARRFLYLYAASIAGILILSSQLRMAVTALVFVAIALKMSGMMVFKVRHLILIGALSLVAVGVVEGVRVAVTSEEMVDSDNQLMFSITRTLTNMMPGLENNAGAITLATTSRTAGQLMFLSELMAANRRGASYLYGHDLLQSTYSVIPRVLWPSKPQVVPYQIIMRERFQLSIHDAAPGPLNQFFVEAGWLGVLLGYILFGFGIGIVTKYAITTRGPGIWILACWIWGSAVILEQELVISTVVTIRNAALVFVFFKLCSLTLRVMMFDKQAPGIDLSLTARGASLDSGTGKIVDSQG
jgi:hypothetical protein